MAELAVNTGRLTQVRRTIRLVGVLAWAAFRAETQYRANLFMVFAGVIYQIVGFAFIWVILSRFTEIGGWRIADIAFLYGIRLTAHGLWVVPFNRLLDLDQMVREAQFDRLLVRPLNPLIQLATSRFWLGSFGDIIGGVVILGVATTLVDVAWTPITIVYLGFAVVGGAFVEASIQLAAASLTFRLLNARSLQLTLDTVFNTFGNYPLKIFGAATSFALTFVLPLAFVAYLPASVLLNRTNELYVAPALAYGAPLVGFVTFTLAYRFWRRQLRHYQSTGS